MSKFAGWLAGILSAVIGGCLVWYLTLPPASITFEGMVYDSAANGPVPNAMITLQIAGAADAPWHFATDNQGSYKLIFNGLKKASKASIQVTANGFQSDTIPPFAVEEDNRRDVPLTRNNTGGGNGVSHPPPLVHVLRYIPVPDAEAIKVRLR